MFYIYVMEMWTTAISVPIRGCPPLVYNKVFRSEDSETLDGVCEVLPIKIDFWFTIDWDQTQVTIVWNTRETGNIYSGNYAY